MDSHVEVIENVSVARAVYSSTELNQEIPPELYGIVADLMIYIYQLKGKKG